MFLFGMDIMGGALERRAGGRLHSILEKLTDNKLAGLATGLGLAIVKHGALFHNARVSLDSTEGVGTSVTVEFKRQ